MEFGCGSGVVSLLMAVRNPAFRDFELFEIQPELYRYAAMNVNQNPLEGRTFTVRCEDVRFAVSSLQPDIVVCNPPFRSPKAGRVSANFQRAIARNWFFFHPSDLFTAFLRFRRDENTGLCLVLPAAMAAKWQKFAFQAGLHGTHLQFVHSFADQKPSLFLARFANGEGKPLTEQIVLYEKDGRYTKIAREILSGI